MKYRTADEIMRSIEANGHIRPFKAVVLLTGATIAICTLMWFMPHFL